MKKPAGKRRCSPPAAWLAALLLAVPAGAAAQGPGPNPRGRDVSGRLGIGTVTSDAHLAVRYLWSPRYGFDAGLGFAFLGAGDVDSRIVVEGAFLYAMAPGERVNFFLRPGIQFRNVKEDGGSTTTIGLRAALEFDYFVTENLAVGARVGGFVDSVSPPGGASNRTDWGLFSGLLTEAGFHFYLPARD